MPRGAHTRRVRARWASPTRRGGDCALGGGAQSPPAAGAGAGRLRGLGRGRAGRGLRAFRARRPRRGAGARRRGGGRWPTPRTAPARPRAASGRSATGSCPRTGRCSTGSTGSTPPSATIGGCAPGAPGTSGTSRSARSGRRRRPTPAPCSSRSPTGRRPGRDRAPRNRRAGRRRPGRSRAPGLRRLRSGRAGACSAGVAWDSERVRDPGWALFQVAGLSAEAVISMIDRRLLLAGGLAVPGAGVEATRQGLARVPGRRRVGHGRGVARRRPGALRTAAGVPPAEAFVRLSADLAALGEAFGRERGEPARRELRKAGALLAEMMAVTVASLGDLTACRRWERTARQAADASGDLHTRLFIRGQEILHGLISGARWANCCAWPRMRRHSARLRGRRARRRGRRCWAPQRRRWPWRGGGSRPWPPSTGPAAASAACSTAGGTTRG